MPQLSTPKQSERWSDLMLLMTWELWLVCDIVTVVMTNAIAHHYSDWSHS